MTSNHVHVVAEADDAEAVARLMQLPSGVVAKTRNRRKGGSDSVWEHPYQCTMIESGTHLMHCLRYVDMNMVRAGKVSHPRQWRWCGYDELTGRRQRYRILDVQRLADRLNLPDAGALFELHEQGVAEAVLHRHLERQAHWTESLAVGSREFVSLAESLHRNRCRFERTAVDSDSGTTTWSLREPPGAYGAHSEAKSQL